MAEGFTEDDYEPVEVWPEHWLAWQTFVEMSGQWRLAPMGGVTGLDYTPLFMRMQRLALDDAAWNDLFADVRLIEAAAMEQMRANQ